MRSRFTGGFKEKRLTMKSIGERSHSSNEHDDHVEIVSLKDTTNEMHKEFSYVYIGRIDRGE
jgi:hypothetical protein